MAKYITTPIYYLNGEPHLGHAYTTILGDILKRALLIQGEEVFYTTGTDEHGQKNQEACEKSGLSFEEFSKKYSDNFKHLFEKLNIQTDLFVRTSFDYHKEVVKTCLDIVYKKGLIVKKNYVGLYCKGCEQFKKESDLDERGFCPDHQVAPEKITEENYFLKLEPYRQWLIDQIKLTPDWIQPAVYANEVLNLLKEPLDDLNISRPKSRTDLGIELPFDTNYVTYIWFDALINYISSLNWPKDQKMFDKFWPNSIHLMAKDIIKPHCIYWPIMLKSLDIPAPSSIMIHGYLVGEGNIKMSKSIGNVVDPVKVIGEIGVDAFRFYMAHTSAGAKDAPISERLIRVGYEMLANNLGNLHMRTYKMLEKYTNKTVPDATLRPEDKEFLENISKSLKEAVFSLKTITDIPKLTEKALKVCSELNAYVDKKEPWKLAKDETKKEELLSCLYTLAEGIRIVAIALNPVMPEISDKILVSFGVSELNFNQNSFNIGGLSVGNALGEAIMLFPRLEEIS